MALAVETISPLLTGQRRRQGLLPRHAPLLAGGLGASLVLGGWLFATLATMHGMGSAVADGRAPHFEASLGLNALAPVPAGSGERRVHLSKFSRLTKTPVLATADAAPARPLQARASAGSVALLRSMASVDGLARAAPAGGQASVQAVAGLSPSATAVDVPLRAHAMVEPDTLATGALPKPFSLVLSNEDTAERLPDLGPLPLTRPGIAAASDAQGEAAPPGQLRDKPARRTLLAYARPDAAMDGTEDGDDTPVSRPLFGGRKGVAIYDISAGVVHMPNGERLEAHSGIGGMRDNPDYVHVPMKGPTPPGTYKVTMREALFHGVEAVRLTPVDGVAPHGRVGLLAHSYLLRKRGDSHGCVAFAHYPKFLSAFKRGEIKQMVIVKSMKGGFTKPAKTLASLFSRKG